MKIKYGVQLINFDLIHWFDSLKEAKKFAKNCGFEYKIKIITEV